MGSQTVSQRTTLGGVEPNVEVGAVVRAISASSDLRSGRAGPILTRGTRRSGRLALGAARAGLAAVSGCNPVHPGPIHLLRSKLELEALAHHAGQEAAHRVLLPARRLHHGGNPRPRV